MSYTSTELDDYRDAHEQRKGGMNIFVGPANREIRVLWLHIDELEAEVKRLRDKYEGPECTCGADRSGDDVACTCGLRGGHCLVHCKVEDEG